MSDDMEPEFKELWEEFKSHGGTRRDWDNLILKPEWPDIAVSWISSDDPDHGTKLKEVMTQYVHPGDMIEFVVRNQKGLVTGEALGRVENLRSVKGHYSVKFYHLATTDEHYHEWAKEHLNQLEDFEMHFCKMNASSCQIKPFTKRTGFFHVDTFRLIPFWMGVKLGYAKDAVVGELGTLVRAWADQENLGLEGPGESPAVAAVEEAALAEDVEEAGGPPGYGGAVEDTGGRKLTSKERARVVANTTTAKAAPPARKPAVKRPLAEDDREAKSHAATASKALGRKSPEMVRLGRDKEDQVPKRLRVVESAPSRPKVELRGRADPPNWMDEIAANDDSSVPDKSRDKRRREDGPPGGGARVTLGRVVEIRTRRRRRRKSRRRKREKVVLPHLHPGPGR